MSQFENITYLMIETNSSCNLKCSWCNRERLVKEGLRQPKNVTVDEFKSMLDFFKDCPIDTVKLEGISEPLLHPQFDLMAQTLKDYFPKAFVIIATNCQYNVERTAFFRTLPFVDMIYLSVDGTGKIFEEHRTGASYEKLLRTFQQLKEKIPADVRKKKLYINFTATEGNHHTLPEVYELCDIYGFAGVRINIVQNWNEEEVNSHSFSDGFINTITRYKKDLKGVPGWEYQECFWPFSGIIVDVFGNFRQCIINTSQKPLGNIFTDNVREIFNHGQHYQNVRKQLASNCSPESCKTCDYHHQSKFLESVLGGKHIQNIPRKFNKCS